jgi:hypothetical protein
VWAKVRAKAFSVSCFKKFFDDGPGMKLGDPSKNFSLKKGISLKINETPFHA